MDFKGFFFGNRIRVIKGLRLNNRIHKEDHDLSNAFLFSPDGLKRIKIHERMLLYRLHIYQNALLLLFLFQ